MTYIFDQHEKNWSAVGVVRRVGPVTAARRMFEKYLRAMGETFEMGRVSHVTGGWNRKTGRARIYTCGCRVPVGYPLYRAVRACKRHRRQAVNV